MSPSQPVPESHSRSLPALHHGQMHPDVHACESSGSWVGVLVCGSVYLLRTVLTKW